MGNPEILLSPIETLLRVDAGIAHPTYLNQPFIQVPKAEPNSDLNFSAGEKVYEIPASREWKTASYFLTAIWSNYFLGMIPIMDTYYQDAGSVELMREFSTNKLEFNTFITVDYFNLIPFCSVVWLSAVNWFITMAHKRLTEVYAEKLQYN